MTTETEHDLKQQIGHLNRIIERLNDRLDDEQNDYNAQIERLCKVNDELEAKVEARDRQIEVWKANQKRLCTNHEAEMEQRCKVNDEQKKHIETLQAMCAIQKSTNEKLLEKGDTLRGHVADLQKTIEKQATEIKELTGKPSAETVRRILDQQYLIDNLKGQLADRDIRDIKMLQLSKDLAVKHEFAKRLDMQAVSQFEKDKEMISSLRTQLRTRQIIIRGLEQKLRTIKEHCN